MIANIHALGHDKARKVEHQIHCVRQGKAKAINTKTCIADWLVWKAERGYCLRGLYAPVAQMDQSGRFLNGKSRFDSGREHHFPLIFQSFPVILI